MTDEKYKAAVNVFLREPEGLTGEHIDTLTRVDEQLGARAVRKRDAFQAKAADARHRAALGQPIEKESVTEAMADEVIDQILLAVAQPKRRIKQLEERNERLERRLLEVEALLAGRMVSEHVDR